MNETHSLFLIRRGVFFGVSLLGATCLVACGGGGGDDDGNESGTVTFSGHVTDTTPAARALSGVAVCALGSCATTDSAGAWQFAVSDTVYDGGSIGATLTGEGYASGVSLPDLAGNTRAIEADFELQTDNSVVLTRLLEDGVAQDLSGGGNGGEEEEPLSTDPSERACQILERSNISIPNTASPVVQTTQSDCPVAIEGLVVVGNIHAIPYDYEITVDRKSSVLLEEAGGTLNQGQLHVHDASYLCDQPQDFVATVTARVVRYYPPDGSAAISTEEAVALCGAGAHVGNTTESVTITFDVPESGSSSSSSAQPK